MKLISKCYLIHAVTHWNDSETSFSSDDSSRKTEIVEEGTDVFITRDGETFAVPLSNVSARSYVKPVPAKK